MKIISIRRNVQQVVHCAKEALSVIEAGEDIECAIDDLNQCKLLLDAVLPKLKRELQKESKGV